MEIIYPDSRPNHMIGEPGTFMGENLEELRARILKRTGIKPIDNPLTALTLICSGEPEYSFMLKYLGPA